LSRDLPFTEEEMVAVEGSAGTLIVFDTDVFHKTGNVVSGERRVMRSFSTIVSVPMVKSEAPKKSFLQRIFGK
jgi:ectoine hydroxylase-related dioxygenase (phytanoyl-CoA dioxygenase family)